jgi:hypothetical protein
MAPKNRLFSEPVSILEIILGQACLGRLRSSDLGPAAFFSLSHEIEGIHWTHRNLRTRTSLLAQVLQIFLGKEHLVKNELISTLDKVVYFKGTIFQWSTKHPSTSHDRAEIS